MSKTTIEWACRPGTVGETLNPTTGCNKVNRGCKHCYAEIMHNRLMKMMPEKYSRPFLDGAFPYPAALDIPLTWKKPRTVFVDSMSDLFHKTITFLYILQFLEIADATPQHTYLILTKRPERAVEFQTWMNDRAAGIPEAYPNGWKWPSNVWLGTSCNDQKSAEQMIPYLLQLDVSVRFLSYEPATGPVNLTAIKGEGDPPYHCHVNVLTGKHNPMETPCPEFPNKLDWVIAGGESGNGSEPAHPDWFRQVRDDCKAAGVPFFFKQWGNWQPIEGPPHLPFPHFQAKNYLQFREPSVQWMQRTATKSFNLLDGRTHQEWPTI